MEEPSLVREIGKVAWFAAKLMLLAVGSAALLLWVFLKNPWLAFAAVVIVQVVGTIVFIGWSNFKWKKKTLLWDIQREEREKKNEESLKQFRRRLG